MKRQRRHKEFLTNSYPGLSYFVTGKRKQLTGKSLTGFSAGLYKQEITFNYCSISRTYNFERTTYNSFFLFLQKS